MDEIKSGDRVRIKSGPYAGQQGVVRTIVANGAFVRMDGDAAVFRPVKFEHLEVVVAENFL